MYCLWRWTCWFMPNKIFWLLTLKYWRASNDLDCFPLNSTHNQINIDYCSIYLIISEKGLAWLESTWTLIWGRFVKWIMNWDLYTNSKDDMESLKAWSQMLRLLIEISIEKRFDDNYCWWWLYKSMMMMVLYIVSKPHIVPPTD